MNSRLGAIIHHTVSPQDRALERTIAGINAEHRGRGYPISELGYYVGYHYVIAANGQIQQTRADIEAGAHTKAKKANFSYLGIALIGDFRTDELTEKQEQSLIILLKRLSKLYGWSASDIRYHGEFTATICPGPQIKRRFGELKARVFSNINTDNTLVSNTDNKSAGHQYEAPTVPLWGLKAANYWFEKGVLTNLERLEQPMPKYELLELMRKISESGSLGTLDQKHK